MKVNPVNIFAIPRSGTTWLAKMIAFSKYFHFVPEFMKPTGGLYNKSKPFYWYECLDKNITEKQMHYLDKIFKLNYNDERNFNILNRISKRIHLYYKYTSKNIKGYPQAITNDPFIVFSKDFITKRYSTKNIILVRHPAAVYLSFKRMGWNIDLSVLLNDQISNENINLIEKYKKSDLLHKIPVLWNVVYDYLLNDNYNENNDLLVFHESVSMNPHDEFTRIFDFLAIPYNEKFLNNIIETTSNDLVNPLSKETHILRRNSKELANSWKSKIAEKELTIIQGIANPLLSKLYYE